MEEIYCYSFVEDAPSRETAIKLAEFRNRTCFRQLRFNTGFPAIVRGASNLRKRCPSMLNMARQQMPVFCITDLDAGLCASALIVDWFGVPRGGVRSLPKELVFRVAVREIEAWIMADRDAWANYIEIAPANFAEQPDELPDPKQFLLNVIRSKGKKKRHKNMLPRGSAHVGPIYNEVLCDFINTTWSPARASENSPSLRRAIDALMRLE